MVNLKKIINSKKFTRIIAAVGVIMCLASCFCASAYATDPASSDSVDQVLSVMDKFAEKSIGANGIGSKVLTFITSNPLLLIGMAAFLLIMIIGVVRRFIIGV